MELKSKKVMVAGTGVSGIGAVNLLNKAGAAVILYDGNGNMNENEIIDKLKGNKAQIVIGELEDSIVSEVELLVISPGVAIDSDIVHIFKKRKVPVWGEIELAYNYEKGKVLAITGTNGKTTTTALVGKIAEAYTMNTYIVGNIGKSYTGEVLNTSEDSITVAEISSFQLESIHRFKPAVSAILNITPDHLNRHKTMENYALVKERISENQTKNETCVLNYDDATLREFGSQCPASVVWFSRTWIPEKGSYLDGDTIYYQDGEQTEIICKVNELHLIGIHNYENVCAAVAIAKAAGIPTDIIIKEVKAFQAVEHRIEYVSEKNGVIYYNDSKGTNTDASIKAIEAMVRPTLLIGGGYDKNSEFDEFIKAFGGKVKMLILLGQTGRKMAETARKYGFENIIMADNLEAAVGICAQNAVSGDAVLLSPACASWDMFDSYEQRGTMFKDYVNAL